MISYNVKLICADSTVSVMKLYGMKIKRGRFAILGIVVAIAFVFSSDVSLAIDADPNNAIQVTLGNKVFTAQCAECHRSNLTGEPNWRVRSATGELPSPPLNGTAHTWHHTDSLLFEVIKEGPGAALPGYKTKMRPFTGKLTDDDIWAVIAYIKSKWPPNIRARNAEMQQRAK